MTTLRDKMPDTARVVDEMRTWLGRDAVDKAIRTAEKARKEFERVLATEGEDAAERWRARNWDRCTFHAEENGHVIGLKVPASWVAVRPYVDERLVRQAEGKLQAEREQAKRKKAHGTH